jgi:ubiquinone/menaquinone biosynthesis C-methylase UbiE
VPELDAIFLSASFEEAEFFVEMAESDGVDVWAVDAEELPVEDGPDGWLICRRPIAADRVALAEANARVGSESGKPGVREVIGQGRAWSWQVAPSDDEARRHMAGRVEELRREGMGDVTVERWSGGEVVERVELEGSGRYEAGFTSFVLTHRRSDLPPIDPIAAAGFSQEAEAYEKGRPSYPAAAVEFVIDRLELVPGKSVLDLAAGTGKLTRLLVPSGARVIAIEPIAEMRAQLQERVPTALVLAGRAEQIPLPPASVDAATVAQAFHWFAAGEALQHLHRVLRPRGGLALIWNRRDLEDPVQVAVAEVVRKIRPDESSHAGQPWLDELRTTTLFGPVEEATFEFVEEIDAATLVGRTISISFVAALPLARKRAVAEEIERIAATLPERFAVRYQTTIQVCYRSN